MFMWDWHHLVFVALPLMLLMGAAQLFVMFTYGKYARIRNRQGITGAEAALVILRSAGVPDVRVEMVDGWLTDHYSPREKVLRLSSKNYQGTSIAAVGVAAHEAGHAIQHARAFAPLLVRNLAVPLASIGSQFGYIAILAGIFLMGPTLNTLTAIGLGLIACVALFQVVNLPVEFDASRRALQVLPGVGILTEEETQGARKVLSAAALTYVAATVAAVWELLYWAMRLGLLGGRRDD
jgi:hypothetical protein